MCIKYPDQSLWHMISTIKMCAIIIYHSTDSLSFTQECELHEVGGIFLFGAFYPQYLNPNLSYRTVSINLCWIDK